MINIAENIKNISIDKYILFSWLLIETLLLFLRNFYELFLTFLILCTLLASIILFLDVSYFVTYFIFRHKGKKKKRKVRSGLRNSLCLILDPTVLRAFPSFRKDLTNKVGSSMRRTFGSARLTFVWVLKTRRRSSLDDC